MRRWCERRAFDCQFNPRFNPVVTFSEYFSLITGTR